MRPTSTISSRLNASSEVSGARGAGAQLARAAPSNAAAMNRRMVNA
jgi:hypothetical protein